MTNVLREKIAQKGLLLADGATGTNLFAMGLQTGDSPELWNTDHPERIRQLHRDFIEAGSDIILTNSFGGTHYRLGLHQAQTRVSELNTAAADIAKSEVARSGKEVLVAGSMGPTGEILEPNGTVSIDDAAAAFEEQASALQKGGADLLWMETLSSREEVIAAVRGASTTGLPLIITVSIDTNGRTMMGMTAADLVQLSCELESPLEALGTNCGVGAAEVVAAIINFSAASKSLESKPIIVAKANCGIPEYIDGKIVYNGTPEVMRNYTKLVADAGAQIIGGCCGTTYEHVKAMRETLNNYKADESPEIDKIVSVLGDVSKGAQAQLRGEMSLSAGSASGRGARPSRRRRKSS